MRRLSSLELKKGPWTPDEDQKLVSYVLKHGHGSWRTLPAKAGLRRCGKSCRLRWTNYLNPDIKRGKFSLREERTIIQLHALIGNRWSVIAAHLPKRTDNEIKNYWNTCLKRKLTKMGIDPVTHKPNTGSFNPSQLKIAANISHMAQWENARLEAEARLVRNSFTRVFDPWQTQLGSRFFLRKKYVTLTPPPHCHGILMAPRKVASFLENKYSHSDLKEFADNVEKVNDLSNVKQATVFRENESHSDVGSGMAKEKPSLFPGSIEGLSEIFLDKNDGGSCGIEENNNCWDEILISSDNTLFDNLIF